MKYEVGDMVYWEKSPHIKFFIEEVSNDIRNPWIWSSGLTKPYCLNGVKNYHRPYMFDLGKLINLSKRRDNKLKELGI